MPPQESGSNLAQGDFRIGPFLQLRGKREGWGLELSGLGALNFHNFVWGLPQNFESFGGVTTANPFFMDYSAGTPPAAVKPQKISKFGGTPD